MSGDYEMSDSFTGVNISESTYDLQQQNQNSSNAALQGSSTHQYLPPGSGPYGISYSQMPQDFETDSAVNAGPLAHANSLPNLSYNHSHGLNPLQIPDNRLEPALSWTHDSSPWDSDTISDISRPSFPYMHRARSASLSVLPDYSYPPTILTSPHNSVSGNSFNISPIYPIREEVEALYMSPHLSSQMQFSRDVGLSDAEGSQHAESVGIPTPSRQLKAFTQSSTAPAVRLSARGLASVEYRHKPVLLAGNVEPLSGTAAPRSLVDKYIGVYWLFYDPLWPLVHCQGYGSQTSVLLSLAMAAIGSQHCDHASDRRHGADLFAACTSMIDHVC